MTQPVAVSTCSIQIVVLKYHLKGTKAPWRNGCSGPEAGNEGLEEKPGMFCHNT